MTTTGHSRQCDIVPLADTDRFAPDDSGIAGPENQRNRCNDGECTGADTCCQKNRQQDGRYRHLCIGNSHDHFIDFTSEKSGDHPQTYADRTRKKDPANRNNQRNPGPFDQAAE